MKKITISVTCSFDVEITKEVTDEVYEQLCDIYDNHRREITDEDMHNLNAWEWFEENIKQSDYFNCKYEIFSLDEDETI